MNLRIASFARAAFFLGSSLSVAAQQAQPSVPSRLIANIDAQQTAEPVSKYEFGMFIEHIRTLIYRSLWAEMLDDRKFYFPISSKEPDAPVPQQGSVPRRKCSCTSGVPSVPTMPS